MFMRLAVLISALPGADQPYVRLSDLLHGEGVPADADRLFLRLASGAFSVFFSPPEGGSILDITVRRLQDWAALRQSADARSLRLYARGAPLAGGCTLRECGLRSGALVHCAGLPSAAPRGLHFLHVSVSQGKKWSLEVVADALDTAQRMKELLRKMTGKLARRLRSASTHAHEHQLFVSRSL
jgi:hypothetical protein